jgi:hypothetical protein
MSAGTVKRCGVGRGARISSARIGEVGGDEAAFDHGRTALVVQEAPDDGHFALPR